MHKAQSITTDEVIKIAKLANLKLEPHEVDLFAKQFSETVKVINELNELDTSSIPGTYQVNNLTNITRDDVVELERVLPQQTALREAKKTHNGFFVVPRVIDSAS